MEYILTDMTAQPGRHGVTLWRFRFYSLADGTLWEMTTDATYRNFRRSGWQLVTEQPDPWGAYQNLQRTQRRTREGLGVITADSPAQIVWRAQDRAQALAVITAREQELHPDLFHRQFQELEP